MEFDIDYMDKSEAFIKSLDNASGWQIIKGNCVEDAEVSGNFNDHKFDDGAPSLKWFDREKTTVTIEFTEGEDYTFVHDSNKDEYYVAVVDGWVKLDSFWVKYMLGDTSF